MKTCDMFKPGPVCFGQLLSVALFSQQFFANKGDLVTMKRKLAPHNEKERIEGAKLWYQSPPEDYPQFVHVSLHHPTRWRPHGGHCTVPAPCCV